MYISKVCFLSRLFIHSVLKVSVLYDFVYFMHVCTWLCAYTCTCTCLSDKRVIALYMYLLKHNVSRYGKEDKLESLLPTLFGTLTF